MAAGLGFKDFVTGEVLTAADVDGYLMQGVWVFASAAARDSAVTSPQEGNFAYLKDTNVTTYYTGSAWANLDTTGMTNPMTTTGDTIYSSSGSTPARLGIGTAGQVLKVNSGATAPEWGTAASGGMTLLETITLSGSSVTSSTISGTYKNLQIVIRDFLPSTDNAQGFMRFNGDSGGNYAYGYYTATDNITVSDTSIVVMRGNDNSVADGLCVVNVYDYANAVTNKVLDYRSVNTHHTTTANMNVNSGVAIYKSTSALTTVTLFANVGNFSSGSMLIYGVS